MSDFKSEFLEFLSSHGFSPNDDIIGDDKWRRARVNGERKRELRYVLKIMDNFASGGFMYKGCDYTHWSSKTNQKLSKGEYDALKARIEADRIANENERQRKFMTVAEKSQRMWKSYKPASPDHPYLKKKKIEPLNIRQTRDILVLPMFECGQLWNLQFINSKGEKRFLTGGKTKDCYGSLVFKNDDCDIIIITEGYATANSIRTATGLPVFFSYTAGNLYGVTKAIRKKFPDAKIIIAADNDAFTMHHKNAQSHPDYKKTDGNDDQWSKWREEGLLYNTGVDKATEAAREFGAEISIPEFKDLQTKPTDYNDLHVLEGLEVVKEQVLLSRAPHTTEIVPQYDGGDISHTLSDDKQSPPSYDDIPDNYEAINYVPDHIHDELYSEDTKLTRDLYKIEKDENAVTWNDLINDQADEKLIFTKHGDLSPNSLVNVDLMIRYHPEFKDLFCYDEFAHIKTVVSCPPWEDPRKFKVREISDEDYTRLAIEMERKGLKPAIPNIKKILDSSVRKKTRHPAREYFGNLKWDGKPRLDTWLTYYCGAEHDNAEYLKFVGRKWITAIVARIFHAGTPWHHMPIFEGDQGARKSSMLEELATIHGKAYFEDGINVSELGNDKIVPKLQGVLIVEMAEMSGLNRKDVNELKQAITSSNDRIIRKYANEPTSYPRQFVFAGTINPTEGYLDDPTGARRFWPVRVGKRIDIDAIARDKEQLWAEAVECFKSGEKLYLTPEEEKLAKVAQDERSMSHPWLPIIEQRIMNRDIVDKNGMDEIWEALGVPKYQRDKRNKEQISKIMVQLGYEWKRTRMDDGSRPSVWMKKVNEEEVTWG
jgi:putative DNA primase/helicase